MNYTLHTMRQLNGSTAHYATINNVDYLPVPDGVILLYPCGTKRFISNGWYNDAF